VPVTRLSDRYRTAFVTGASTGLGRAFTEMLLADGIRVWGTSRDVTRLSDLAARNPARFMPVALDLRAGAKAEAIFVETNKAAGDFDIVINNAGYGVFADFAATEFSVWQEQIEVMLVSTARLSHAALRKWRAKPVEKRPVALVNISSLAAEFPLPFQSAYNVCKSGLSALNESLMIECSDTNIAVIDFRPGDYRTDFERSVRRPAAPDQPRLVRAWAAFETMMQSGPPPAHAAIALKKALVRGRSGTVRRGRFFQAVVAPFIARFGSLALRRRIQALYFDVS
jgi:short-subunit dehydrogenase